MIQCEETCVSSKTAGQSWKRSGLRAGLDHPASAAQNQDEKEQDGTLAIAIASPEVDHVFDTSGSMAARLPVRPIKR